MMYEINPATIAALAPLMGTLTPEGANTALQAVEEEQMRALADQTRAATEQMNSALGQYQQAAAAPTPNAQTENFVSNLFSGMGSIIGQNPAYQQRAGRNTEIKQSDLMASRRENLLGLRDIYAQRAKAADEAGDLEVAEKMRIKKDRAERDLERMLNQEKFQNQRSIQAEADMQANARQRQGNENELAQIRARGVEERKTRTQQAQDSPAVRAQLIREGVDPKSGFMMGGFARRQMAQYQAMSKRKDEKSRNEAKAGMLRIATERWATDTDPSSYIRRLKRLYDPSTQQTQKELRYLITGDKVYKRDPKNRNAYIKDAEAEARLGSAIADVGRDWFSEEGEGE